MEDNRRIYKTEYWKQGRVLETRETLRWDGIERMKAEREENCCAFVSFNEFDQGRTRILVYKYNTPDECLKEINKHNKKIDKTLKIV